MEKKESKLTIHTLNKLGKTIDISSGEVKIIQKTDSNNSLDSDELILLNEITKKNKSEPTEEAIESVSIASSSEKHNDYTSQTKILSSEEKSDCGTFDCMGKNDDFCCVII